MNRILFVTVCVADQDRALAFYQAIGFEKRGDRRAGDDHGWLTIVPPGAQTGITLYYDPLRAGQSSFVYGTDDIAALYDRWSEAGIAFIGPPTPQEWGVQALLEDPDGNSIVVVQPQ